MHVQAWECVGVTTQGTTLDQQGAEAGELMLPSSTLRAPESEMPSRRALQGILTRTAWWLPV